MGLYDALTSGSGTGRKSTGFKPTEPSLGDGGKRYLPDSAQTAGTNPYPFGGPGVVDFDITNPFESAGHIGHETEDMFKGLKATLFGTEQADPNGHHGGIFGIGDVPILGDALRVVGGIPGGLGDIAKGIGDAGGQIAERIPLNDPKTTQMIRDQFAALPLDSPARIEAQKQIDADGGLLGTGYFNSHLVAMNKAIQKYNDEENPQPDLYGNLIRPTTSLADTFTNIFGLISAPVRAVERATAGAARPGSGNMNQMEMIRAVGSGNAAWTSDDPGLTPVEQIAYDKTTSGQWTDAQALDYIASHGAGFSHNKALEIAGGIALDPTLIGAMGAGAIAKVGRIGGTLSNLVKDAEEAVKIAQASGDAEKLAAANKALNSLKAEGLAAGSKVSPRVAGAIRGFGDVYAGNNAVGKAAKIVRTIIDPLHGIGANPKAQAAIEEGSLEVTRAASAAYHGETGAQAMEHAIQNIPQLGAAGREAINKGFAIYAANFLRKTVGVEFRASNLLGKTAEQLRDFKPMQAMTGMLDRVNNRVLQRMEEQLGQFVRHVPYEQADMENIADRAAAAWNGLSKEEWLAEFARNKKVWTPERLSFLHAATYGTTLEMLDAARTAAKIGQQTGHWADRLSDLILINKQTLTDLGHEGIMARLGKAKTLDGKLSVIEQAMADYPRLRNFPLDRTSPRRTIEAFEDMMGRIQESLPAQIRDAERPNLPSALRDFDEKTRHVFTLGLRPADEYAWGLERDADGLLHEVSDPWFDHVTTNIESYSASRELSFNAAGKPLPGVVKAGARALDRMEALGRMAKHGITGTMVSTAARSRFTQKVMKEYSLSENEVRPIFEALEAEVAGRRGFSSIRGLSGDDMWEATRALVPSKARALGLGPRELLVHVLEAYNGDLRTVGLTQAFTGRAKTFYAKAFGANTLAEIAEHVWPTLKFRFNAFFQVQEKIEPWVLNSWRGASIAVRKSKATEADYQMLQMVRNLTDHNIVHWADNDIAELGRTMGWGNLMEEAAKQNTSVLGAFQSRLRGIVDVQGIKQLNMLRTMQKGLGREMKGVWEQMKPGEWDQMVRQRSVQAGRRMSDDEFAVALAAENLDANKIVVNKIIGKNGQVNFESNFSRALRTGQWAEPQHLGELRPLDLSGAVADMDMVDIAGNTIRTEADLRRALASGRVAMADVKETLRLLGAHNDYIERFESAVTFSWPKFFGEVQETFGLSNRERIGIEDYFARVAQAQDMTPLEYVSQVYSPVITNNGLGAVGSLGRLVEFSRGGRLTELPDLAQLTGRAGESTIEDLYRQMGAIMSHHLHPSAKAKFLHSIMPELEDQVTEGALSTDFASIMAKWTPEVESQYVDRIIRFMRGRPGEGVFTPVDDTAGGVAAVRDAAQGWMADAGRPRNMQRGTIAYDHDLGIELRDAVDARPQRFFHTATDEDLAKPVDLTEVGLVAKAPVDLSHYSDAWGSGGLVQQIGYKQLNRSDRIAYKAYTSETRALYTHLTETLGYEVKTVRPNQMYRTAGGLRRDLAARRIKVPDSGYWHPVLGQEDAFMARVVSDVFGYGQEALEFGDHNATMALAAMYTDDARRVTLSEDFARGAWERHTETVITNPSTHPTTVAGYEARWGARAPRPTPQVSDINGVPVDVTVTRSVGSGVHLLPEDVQRELITGMGQVREMFPDVPIASIDVQRIGAAYDNTAAATLSYGTEAPTIVFDYGFEADDAARAANRASRAQSVLNDREMGAVPGVMSGTPLGDIYHEFAHAVDKYLHHQYALKHGAAQSGQYLDEALTDLLDNLRNDPVAQYLSTYATSVPGATPTQIMPYPEVFAELFDLTFNPENAHLLDRTTDALPPALVSYAEAFKARLAKAGVYHETPRPLPVNPHAGKTVAEANAAARAAGKPAVVPAERHVGLIDPELSERVTKHYIGTGRYAEGDPDVARSAAFLHQHMSEAVTATMREGEASQWAKFLTHDSGFPVKDAVPYDLTQALVKHGTMQSMASKFDDAFRLQYFSQSRSALQRSINHPMFGIYPASYMYGKILPEMIRFIAREPFGVRTGAGAMTMWDLQKAITVQRNYDPQFDAMMEKIGSNAAGQMLGYMLPATPWSIPSSFPGWLRDLAGQGLENERAVEAGQNVDEVNWITPLQSVIKRTAPYTTTVPWLGRAGDAARDIYAPEEDAQPTTVPGFGTTRSDNAPVVDTSERVSGTELGPILGQSIEDLRSLFGR